MAARGFAKGLQEGEVRQAQLPATSLPSSPLLIQMKGLLDQNMLTVRTAAAFFRFSVFVLLFIQIILENRKIGNSHLISTRLI